MAERRPEETVLKYHRVIAEKARRFQRDTFGNRGGPRSSYEFTWQEAYLKVTSDPYCYLTGREINLDDSSDYQFDHIIPISQGGTNTLDNLGLASAEANQAKGSMSEKEFVELCRAVCENYRT